MRWLVIFLLISTVAAAQNTLPPLGSWREHLPYQSAIDVAATEEKIFAATPYSLFSIDRKTKEIERISKVAGLSETGISRIAYDGLSGKLFIAYTNSNIDVLVNGKIKNIPAIKRANISGDKRIYHIFPAGQRCYLSTGFGIVVLDAEKYEVKETWYPGQNGNHLRTYAFTSHQDQFYAATDDGLKTIAANHPNPGDFNNWQTVSGANGLPPGAAIGVETLNGRIIVLSNEGLYMQSGTQWTLFFKNDWPIISMNASEAKLIVSQRRANGDAQLVILNETGTTDRIIQQPGFISYPLFGIREKGEYWIADLYGGLTHWTGNSFASYRLNSPQDLSSGEMVFADNVLYVTAGAVNSSWNYQYNPSGFYKYENGTWTNYNRYAHPVLDSVSDIITVAVDPRDESAWLGSFGGGLIHLSGNDLQLYKQNSPLLAPIGDPGSYRVSGLAFDDENNLWIANFGAAQQLHVLKNNGQWQSFSAPFFLRENAVAQIVVDDAGQKWIVSPLGNGLIVFDEGSFENQTDDKWRIYKTGSGSGNLPSSGVLSIAKDKNGFIWVGTNNGIAVIECPENAFANNGCDAVWPVVKEGNFANYLFKGQEVRAIAVDGANRKWVATATGAWLINPEGDKVITRFTEENSGLLSNDVKQIAINGSNGEVYFATANGISSYRAEATTATAGKLNVLVYPNPVPPGYAGSIAIRGLPENSIVKITELNGRLVHQSRSFGGQAVWNGKDYNNRSVASGVYLVLAIDERQQESVVGKIVFVSGKK